MTARSALPAAPVVDSSAPRRGAGVQEVRLHPDGFWGQRQRVNAAATFEHCTQWMERLGWLGNFDTVSGQVTRGDRPGWQFSDSEVYKLMEGLAWELGREPDPRIGKLLDSLVDRIAPAQDPDGYLNTCFGHAGQRERYSDMESGHELYCAGHLLQAAVACVRNDVGERLVEIARRVADHVCREFGEQGREAICGHPEIELGLVELGRALDEPRYVEQAQLFVDRRGRGLLGPIPLLGPTYFQDDVPVREARAWRGHAVRALYLSAAAVDVAQQTGDAELLEAVVGQWQHSVERRTYITGGMGSRHQDEGFGEDWELPADRAYCETCAGIASTMVSWRLYLATGDVRYVDLMERTCFNVLATSTDPAGTAFFYANSLHQRSEGEQVRPDEVNPRAEGSSRAPWFEVSCCPTNVARTLASWQTYAVGVSEQGVDLLQHVAGEIDVQLRADESQRLRLRVDTRYPDDGRVVITVLQAPEREVVLRLRVPSWARGAELLDGQDVREVEPGWAVVQRRLVVGEVLRLRLPLEPRWTFPDPRVDALRGCAAVERGPLVLCLESPDLPAGTGVDDVVVDVSSPPQAHADGARVVAAERGVHDGVAVLGEQLDLPLVPYHRWAQRGPATMRVFLPLIETAAPGQSPRPGSAADRPDTWRIRP